MREVLLATNNEHKIREITEILKDLPLKLVTPEMAGLVDFVPVENGNTYEANALIKAHAFVEKTNLAVLADDSGVETLAFPRFPGVHSADWFPGSDQDRTNALLEKMADQNNRGFCYFSLIAYVDPHEKIEKTFTGKMCGEMTRESRAGEGFGYDPIMIPHGHDKTVAELGDVEKNKISHRRMALNEFANWYRKEYKLNI
ncbi:MAG: RdgB/HAM1 family non-canonical purine NTP pyrophosphatase [Pseudomonadales bacterium]|jgi:XTP/dITP diphosphohydrolase|nr:RdgB/HAM1 family non-canonical purine NTP pyrophosphatase [Pseudomonadales bacterium]